jgi:SAM-dependent methyltransferase
MSYGDKVQEEIGIYEKVEVVHDLPAIFHYWSHNYNRPKLESLGFASLNDFYTGYIGQIINLYPEATCEILSVGSGNCDAEVALAELLLEKGIQNFTFSCLDLNPHMLERGKQLAAERQLLPRFRFIETDVNGWQANRQYQVIIANQSLHHFVELEILFDKIYASLDDNGFFLSNDIIGRNGHMRWPEALEFVRALWLLLEDRHKWNHQLNRFEFFYENWDCSAEGFEGIRAQDILPLLLKRFKFHLFLGFSNLISVFVDRSFGPNFNIENPFDCRFIDFVNQLDDYYMEQGRIKPTQMIAAMTRTEFAPPKIYGNLSPEFSVRLPNSEE